MSTGTLTVMVHRLRRRFGELVREEIAQTVRTAVDLDEELAYLIEVMGHAEMPTGTNPSLGSNSP